MECKLENATIHYEMRGAGRALIMLHGWPCDHRYMMADMEPVFVDREGWKRIYPDLPGMGKTPGRDWIRNQDQMLDITLEFIERVIPDERFTIAGASYGGYLARGVLFHKSALLDGLLLTAPVIEAVHDKRDLPAHVSLVEDASILAGLDTELSKDFQGFAVVQTKKILDYMQENIYPAVEIADSEFLDRVVQQYAFSFDIDKLKEPFQKPMLIVMGKQDSICGYKDAWAILENYPRGTFAVLDRAGHGVGIEQEGLFRALVNEWLDRVEEG